MNNEQLKKMRDDALKGNSKYQKYMELVEQEKKNAASKGEPYFDVSFEKNNNKTIENVLNTLQSQGFERIFFTYPKEDGYGSKLIKYDNDNFISATCYGTTVRVYF